MKAEIKLGGSEIEVRHAPFWRLAPGQLKQGERVELGFRTIEEAAHALVLGEEIRLLETVENDLPVEDAGFDPDQDFESLRLCVVASERE